jgi:hypothetical protein
VAGFLPVSTRYTRPGSYLGQVFRPRPTASTDIVFRACFVGKGNRLALVRNTPIRRSYIEDESLAFPAAPPFVATLDYAAKPDQAVSRLYKQDGTAISTNNWQFQESTPGSGVFDQVLIKTAVFDKTVTYVLDYQSSERTVRDPLPFTDPRQILQIGNFQNQDLYEEYVDFVVPGLANAPVGDSGNTFASASTQTQVTPDSGNTGTGSVVFGASNAYTGSYTRWYKITVTGINAGPPKEVTFSLEVVNHSGGNAASPQVPMTSACPAITFTVKEGETGTYLDTNRLLQDGLYLDYTFGAGNFAIGDEFYFFAYGPALLEAHSSYDTNNSQFATVSDAALEASGTSTSTIAAGTQSEYTGSFVRHYGLKVLSASGTAAEGQIITTLGGISNNEYVVINNGIEKVYFEFQSTSGYVPVTLLWAQENVDASITGVVTVDITSAGVDDDAAAALASEINDDNNWPAGAAEITAVAAGALSGRVDLTSDHVGARGANALVTSDAINIAVQGMGSANGDIGGAPIVATIAWAGYDELPYTTGSFTVTEATSSSFSNIALESGITLTVTLPAFNVANAFVVGDEWTFTARPAREYYQAKDDRDYELEITSALAQTLAGTYAASTKEGGFGTWTTTVSNDGSGGAIALQDNVNFMARNLGNSFAAGVGGAAPHMHRAGDKHTSSVICDDEIKWDIDQRTTETISLTAVRHDVLGTITGTPNTYYVVLDNTPTSVLYVRNASTGADISYNVVASSPYVWFATDPGVNLSIRYQWIGEEPDPAQVYYVTATRLRPTSEYDQPVLWTSPDRARDGLSPSTVDNDLLIMSDIAGELDVAEWYTCQVLDRDDDDIHTTFDYKQSILATEDTPQITDLIVLNKWDALAAAKASVSRCNDMFQLPNKWRFLWTGFPVNTPIGDVDQASSRIYTAKRTLLVSGNDPAHGAYIAIANSWATRTILLDDLTEVDVTLDGSFIAGAAAALQNSFSDTAETLLMKDLSGVFNTMETLSDGDEIRVASNGMTYLRQEGDAVFRFMEDITTDNSAIDYQQINAGKQKQWVVRDLTAAMTRKLTGFVPTDPFSAIGLIKGFVVQKLGNYVAAGRIAPYGAEQNPPTRRPVSAGDVEVFVDENVKTDYYYIFWYNLRYPIKRTSGLFGVDSDAILKGLARAN